MEETIACPTLDERSNAFQEIIDNMPRWVRKSSVASDDSALPPIGMVASFDEILEIITEFYNECKHKKRIESSILKIVVNKQHHKLEESKYDGKVKSL